MCCQVGALEVLRWLLLLLVGQELQIRRRRLRAELTFQGAALEFGSPACLQPLWPWCHRCGAKASTVSVKGFDPI